MKCMDKNFQDLVKPCLREYQTTHSPANSSSSKSQLLLRNTFSYEAYQEFLKIRNFKKQVRDRRNELKEI